MICEVCQEEIEPGKEIQIDDNDEEVVCSDECLEQHFSQ